MLEASLNGLYRSLALASIKKGIDEIEVTKNLDNISFIDKTILFIYNSHFEFGDDLAAATQYHGVIGKLKDFSGLRNALLHGHSIKMVNVGGIKKYSPLKQELNDDNLMKQVDKFQYIIEGVRFYVEHLHPAVKDTDKDVYLTRYLDDNFIKQAQPQANPDS